MKNTDTTKFAFRKTTVTVFAKSAAGAGRGETIPPTSSGCNSATSIWTSSILDTFGTLFG